MWNIKLENFLCHECQSFEFHLDGLHLLKGVNGSGKSTILKAVYFAYFGGIRKPYTFGESKKTTRVTLTHQRYTIERSRSPNRLVIKSGHEELEDEAAQRFIEQKILGMNAEQFLLCTYIRPHARASLVTLSPADQLRMIESFAFDSDLHARHKMEISKMVKERRERLTYVSQKADIDRQYYERERADFEKCRYVVTTDPLREPLEYLTSRISQLEQTIQHDQRNLKRLQSIDPDSLIRLRTLESEHAQLTSELTQIHIDETAADRLDDIKVRLDAEERRIKVVRKMLEFEELRDAYFNELRRERDHLSQFVLSDEMLAYHTQAIRQYNVYEGQRQTYESARERALAACRRVGTHPNCLDHERSELERALQRQSLDRRRRCPRMTCPGCERTLRVDGTTLVETSNEPSKCLNAKSVALLEKKIRVHQQRLEAIERYTRLEPPEPPQEKDIDNIRRQYDQHNAHIVKYRALDKNIESEALSSTLIKMRKGIPESPLDNDPGDIDTLKSTLAKIQSECYANETARKRQESIRQRLTVIGEEIDTLRASLGDVPIDQVHTQIAELINRLGEQQRTLDENRALADQAREYQRYQVHHTKVEELRCRVETENVRITREAEKRYAATLELEKVQKEAEVLSIEDVVETVNQLADGYLQSFFEDESIRVRCEMVKRTQKELKFKVNTTIVYRGVEYTSHEELSQGELVKVNLAFILALNSYFASPLLMLDEMLENLDSHISTEVVSRLRDIARDKCVVVIDHSSIEGMYDHILSM